MIGHGRELSHVPFTKHDSYDSLTPPLHTKDQGYTALRDDFVFITTVKDDYCVDLIFEINQL